MNNIRFLAAARRELLAEVLYYNESEAGLGAKFASAFEQALEKQERSWSKGSHSPCSISWKVRES